MSDNELDNLFKEAAEGFTPPQDESAWKQMATMLDRAPVHPTGFWNWKPIATLTAVGLIAVTAVWFIADDEIIKANVEGNQKVTAKTDKQDESSNANQSVVQKQEEHTQPAGQQNFTPAESLENKSNRAYAVTGIGKKSKKRAGQDNSGSQSHTSITDEVVAESVNHDEATGSELVRTDKDERGSVGVTSTSALASANEPDMEMRADSINSVIQENVLSDSVKDNSDSTQTIKKAPESKRGAFSIKAVVSPDFSSVNYFSAGKTGINYGLLVGYAFNTRWSVYTGVISSKKLYDTQDIENSYSSNGHDYPIKELEGDCRIWDIPINVYYNFFPNRSFSLQAGLGFSSYIMRKENYIYCVDNYGNDAYYQQNVIGENNEWFKIMNLSVIASKKITNRLSAEFEPFVKAPLTGVGEGKVSLVSMGAFFSLKFDLMYTK